jgi:hypothetical protein
MRKIDITILKGAIFSEDRKYRYALWRVWNPNRKLLMQIGLNPSKANEFESDPTITRGMVRSDREGFGGFLMGNLYGYVSTDPKALLRNKNTIGELTDYYLREMIKLSDIQLCAWGSFKPVINRCQTVFSMLNKPYCLSVNADGQPVHPLYTSYDVPMKPYQPSPRLINQ